MAGGDGTHQRTDHLSLAGATQGSQVPLTAQGDATSKWMSGRKKVKKEGDRVREVNAREVAQKKAVQQCKEKVE